MVTADQLWNMCSDYAYASFPCIIGIITGKLPKLAWKKYKEQDYLYIRHFKKGIQKAIELCTKMDKTKELKLFEELNSIFQDVLDSCLIQMQSDENYVDDIKETKPITGYAKLVQTAIDANDLLCIVVMLFATFKLCDFFNKELSTTFSNQSYPYNVWIHRFTHSRIEDICNQLIQFINMLLTPENESSLHHYFCEVIRLQFELLEEQEYAQPPFTESAIHDVGLSSFPSMDNQDFKSSLNQLHHNCIDMNFACHPLSELPSKHLSLGLGTTSELPLLQHYDIPVIFISSTQDLQNINTSFNSQFKFKRLLYLLQFSPSSLNTSFIFYITSLTELEQILLSSIYFAIHSTLHFPTMLTIAGSDSCGGAGIQADIKTASALGVYSSSCITAITYQSTQGVKGLEMVSEEGFKKQCHIVCDDIEFDAIKIGMTGNKFVIQTIGELIQTYHLKNVVLDPVMAASSGYALSKEDICGFLKSYLIPYCTLITPNLPETQMLVGHPVASTVDAMKEAAKELGHLGCTYVLIKGGHLNAEEAVDVLYCTKTGEFNLFSNSFITTQNSHGTGCTLSSAIASYLAKGYAMEEAVKKGKEFITGILRASRFYHIGKGRQGLMNHMFMNYHYD